MKWPDLALGTALTLMAAGCTGTSSPQTTDVTEVSTATALSVPGTTTVAATTTLTELEPDEPPEFTEFESSTACDPAAVDANLQVAQAFVTAYNERDLERLGELVSDSVTIADMSGIPHLSEDDWTGITRWAEMGWSVEDHFELTRLVMYQAGSVFEVERSNDVLRSNGIENLSHSWKVHSSNCVISHVVGYLPFEDLGETECHFWEVFADTLAEGTNQSIDEPEACSG